MMARIAEFQIPILTIAQSYIFIYLDGRSKLIGRISGDQSNLLFPSWAALVSIFPSKSSRIRSSRISIILFICFAKKSLPNLYLPPKNFFFDRDNQLVGCISTVIHALGSLYLFAIPIFRSKSLTTSSSRSS